MQQHDTTYVNRSHKSLQSDNDWNNRSELEDILPYSMNWIVRKGISIDSSINEPTIQILVRLPKSFPP
jgi:endo-beta-N-acetylglucosaminidase D